MIRLTDAELEAAIAECEAYLRRYIGGPKRIAVMDRLSLLRELKELRAFVRAEKIVIPAVGSSDDDHPCVDEREWPKPQSLVELVTQINWIAAEALGRVFGAADKASVAKLVDEWTSRQHADRPAETKEPPQ